MLGNTGKKMISESIVLGFDLREMMTGEYSADEEIFPCLRPDASDNYLNNLEHTKTYLAHLRGGLKELEEIQQQVLPKPFLIALTTVDKEATFANIIHLDKDSELRFRAEVLRNLWKMMGFDVVDWYLSSLIIEEADIKAGPTAHLFQYYQEAQLFCRAAEISRRPFVVAVWIREHNPID